MALRVVFADDNFLVREGVSALLAEGAGIEAAKRIRAEHPGVGVVVLSSTSARAAGA